MTSPCADKNRRLLLQELAVSYLYSESRCLICCLAFYLMNKYIKLYPHMIIHIYVYSKLYFEA